ncbi:MAG: hypothetical protein KDK91_32160, partial [Gammaproteobacteria bacterium]|nr:hypothetical protein [Gammaproteobacteria bacterium]
MFAIRTLHTRRWHLHRYRAPAWLVLVGLLWAMAASRANAEENRLLADAQDKALIASALEQERPRTPPDIAITGVSVPHHLLAPDLIARGLWAASGGHYERVLLLAPDHFRSLTTPFGVATTDLDTVFGPLRADQTLAHQLLKQPELFTDVADAAR